MHLRIYRKLKGKSYKSKNQRDAGLNIAILSHKINVLTIDCIYDTILLLIKYY